ncbi:6-phosphogluconolactonase [Planktothrix sp. FACHB-1355]|uniref:6-phosphogluconolactonase n=1 Tax=Aerosakkonema funiforme FACHB-1375 TaxID=2949571 RepID=A0A926VIV2_9CYAN|nr:MULTISPECIES: 6-phosphogluconolactonase [Oscillatoriales]MBD2183299.1 6-phosphogluconolactonase [Aerosakkonema funiforme FACHB-1375]MBD3560335.1 6-phosphogluconolactonase [Planktothrix sp. FACHB-1355]
MGTNVEVLPSQTALLERSLLLVADKINTATALRGQCTIALSGGSTPKSLYEAIAKQSLPWEKVHVFWGDERYVPPEHPDSNQGMARRAWLDKVDIPAANIHPMPTDAADPAADAQKYELEVREFFGSAPGEFPVFDIVLLGMGDDGHTASLFPHTDVLQARDRAIGVGNKDGQPRLTFTAPLINQARCVIFIVAGANKQSALAQVFAPQGDDMAYPSRLIEPVGELWWLLDESAGGNLGLATSQSRSNY